MNYIERKSGRWQSTSPVFFSTDTMGKVSIFQQMRGYMHRDSLRLALCGQFDSVSQERRIIQSDDFLPVLTAWARTLVGRGAAADSKIDERPQPFAFNENGRLSPPPAEIMNDKAVKEAMAKNPRVRWLVNRLQSGDPLSRGMPVFPSTFKVAGPQWPFSLRQLNYLEHKVGELRGTELQAPIEVEPREMAKVESRPKLYDWPLRDESDMHEPFERHLKHDNFFSNQDVVGDHEAPSGLRGLPKRTIW